jgi:hypothetical protein
MIGFGENGKRICHRTPAWVAQTESAARSESIYAGPEVIGRISSSKNSLKRLRGGMPSCFAETYDSGGEYIFINGASLKGAGAFENLWGNIEGQMIRSVKTVDFPTSRIAIARVTADYSGAVGESRLDETFVVAKDAAGQWRIHIHQGVQVNEHNR